MQAAIFSKKTFIWVLESAGVDDMAGDTHRAFMVFVGAALSEFGAAALTEWFLATFVPLVEVAEREYAD